MLEWECLRPGTMLLTERMERKTLTGKSLTKNCRGIRSEHLQGAEEMEEWQFQAWGTIICLQTLEAARGRAASGVNGFAVKFWTSAFETQQAIQVEMDCRQLTTEDSGSGQKAKPEMTFSIQIPRPQARVRLLAAPDLLLGLSCESALVIHCQLHWIFSVFSPV